MTIFIAFVIGLLIGCVATVIMSRTTSVGSLRIDDSDPLDMPNLFLELSTDVNDVCNKKFVLLKVNTESFISHK